MTNLLNIPKLGFGFMRLPVTDGGKATDFDYTVLNGMVDEFMAQGFNYFDTAYIYYEGESEIALKKSVADRYPRESFLVANKLPGWELQKQADVQRIFDTQLERTGAGYFDFYLLHSIEKHNLGLYDNFDCWNWALEMKKKGLIRHFGFSFHDRPELLDEILTKHPEVEFVMLQINYVDWKNPIVHSGGCYEVARKHNVPIVIMEPVRGGALASMKPEWEAKLKAAAPDRSIASWAMRFCLSLDGVMTVTSGMSTPEQMRDNIDTFKNYTPFSEAEKACLAEVTKEYLMSPIIGCTSCRYCVEGCPANINIPGIISGYNTMLLYGEHDRPRFYYEGLTSNSGTAKACNACGKCEAICPQHLGVIDALKKASAIFDVNS
ncbi:MAG: aldo/keto reductase [Defluviitaleaceae bacterium]|nr:aldo/keto reductase [Defluviitaleaceae bacterium]